MKTEIRKMDESDLINAPKVRKIFCFGTSSELPTIRIDCDTVTHTILFEEVTQSS